MDAMGGKCCGESDCMCSSGSDITTGTAGNDSIVRVGTIKAEDAVEMMRYVTGSPQPRPETGYEDCTDEYLAEQLGGIRMMMQSPQNKAILTEAAMRLVLRGGDDGYHQTREATKPTLEGLEMRLERLERDIKRVTGIDPRQMNNAD